MTMTDTELAAALRECANLMQEAADRLERKPCSSGIKVDKFRFTPGERELYERLLAKGRVDQP